MPDTIEIRRGGDVGPIILGGLIVWLFYWWKRREAAEAGASGSGNGAGGTGGAGGGSALSCDCCESGQAPPEVLPTVDINADEGRFIPGPDGNPPPEINYYGQLVEPGASGLPTGSYVQSASYLEG
jgi:hypothetical protein